MTEQGELFPVRQKLIRYRKVKDFQAKVKAVLAVYMPTAEETMSEVHTSLNLIDVSTTQRVTGKGDMPLKPLQPYASRPGDCILRRADNSLNFRLGG
jgi:hypothetical protein